MNKRYWLCLAIASSVFNFVNAQPVTIASLKSEVAAIAKKGQPVVLSRLLPSFETDVLIPPQIKNKLASGFTLFDVTMDDEEKVPPIQVLRAAGWNQLKAAAGFGGYITFANMKLKSHFRVYENKFGVRQFVFTIFFPTNIKPSQISAELKPLDAFTLPELRFVFATTKHKSADGVLVAKGLNLISLVDLKGPLALLGELKSKAKELDSIIVDTDAPVQLSGSMPTTPKSLTFGMIVPMRFGVDFQKVAGLPKGFSDIIRKITTDDLYLSATYGVKKGTLNVFIQMGVQATIGKNPEPYIVQSFGNINLTTQDISFGWKFPSMIDLTYFALGDSGIELFIESGARELLATLGIPFTGVGLRGRIDLGKSKDARAELRLSSKVAFTVPGKPKPPIDDDSTGGILEVLDNVSLFPFIFAFDVTGKHIYLSDLISLITQKLANANAIKPVASDAMPPIEFYKVRGKYAPTGVSVAGRDMGAGFILEMDANLFDRKLNLFIDANPKKGKLKGKGWTEPVIFKQGANTIFALSGAGKDSKYGTKDDGPYATCFLDPAAPSKTAFNLSTLLEIPPIGLKHQVEFHYAFGKFISEFKTKIHNLDMRFNARLDIFKWREMELGFNITNGLTDYLSEHIKAALREIKEGSAALGSQAQSTLRAGAQEIATAKRGTVSSVNQEAVKVKRSIALLDKQIATLEQQCSKEKDPIKKIAVCAKLAVQQGDKKAKELYLNTLLEPVKDVVGSATQAVADVSSQVEKSGVVTDVVGGLSSFVVAGLKALDTGINIIKVTKATGTIRSLDLAAGKLPIIDELQLVLTVPGMAPINISLKNLVFNFADPAQSARDIAKKIVRSITVQK